MAPAGAGMPVKNLADPGRLVGIVDHHVEARQTQSRGDGEDQHRRPAHGLQRVQRPEEQEQGRRDAEIDEIGKRSSSAPKRDEPFSARAMRPSMPSSTAAARMASTAISIFPVRRETDRGQAGAQRQQA